MYNRYIPQSDGSFRRNHVPDTPSRQAAPRQERPVPCPANEKAEYSENIPSPRPPMPRQKAQRPNCPHRSDSQGTNVLSFLRQLLPRDFDTGDLLVVLLLLLMSSDCTEDQNSALLTLALYLFL